MDYALREGHSRLGEIAVEEFNCIGEKKMLGDGIYHVESLVVLERMANIKSLVVMEVP